MATILDRIKKITAEQLGVNESDVIPTASFIEDLGADSLDLVELVMSVRNWKYRMKIQKSWSPYKML